jgi:hypothetical protein
MIHHSGIVECPFSGWQVDAGSPVLKPYVVAIFDEQIHQSGVHRGSEDIRSNTGSMNKQDWISGGS